MQGSAICNIPKTWRQSAILFLTYSSNGLEVTHNSLCALANASFRYRCHREALRAAALPRKSHRALSGINLRSATEVRSSVVAPVNLIANDCERRRRRGQRIGLPRKSNRGNFYLCFHLADRPRALKSKLSGWVLIKDLLPGRFPSHPETHFCRSSASVECWPSRLIDDRHVLHRQRYGLTVGSHFQTTCGNRHNPIQSARRNGRVKIMDLACGSHRPPK
jgi:hypothetical protein